MTDITLPRAVVEQALRWADQHGEAVYSGGGWDAVNGMNEWAQALRSRLAQPEQEPVAQLQAEKLQLLEALEYAVNALKEEGKHYAAYVVIAKAKGEQE